MSKILKNTLDLMSSKFAHIPVMLKFHAKSLFRTSITLIMKRKEVESRMKKLVPDAFEAIPAEILADRKVAIIIPVYRGIKQTRRCLDSLIHSANKTLHEIILINDDSPEPEMDALLHSCAGKNDHVKVYENGTNLGFVRTVNKGIHLAGEADVILLNNDTEVANDWLDRMTRQAYARKNIATVTPFSNHATICNYPDLDGWQHLPSHETVKSVDTAFSIANPGLAVEIPTAVGFCMFIKRSCLNDVGLFDEITFGRGYGEENDFCSRAIKKGWKNILAADVFVYHEGKISFGESSVAEKAKALERVKKLHPDYERAVSRHIKANFAYPYRIRATAARYRLNRQPVILLITHALGGGTEKHVQELAGALHSEGASVLLLRPAVPDIGNFVELESYAPDDKLKVCLSAGNILLLSKVLRSFGISKIHIHHTIGFALSVEELTLRMGVPYEVTIHDFYAICPRINMLTPGKGFCGIPSVEECRLCLRSEPGVKNIEITSWRVGYASLFSGANHVYCPSQDCADRVSAYFPEVNFIVVPHELIHLPPPVKIASADSKKRLAVLGVLTDHKGYHMVKEMLRMMDEKMLPLEIVLIGYPDKPLQSNALMTTGFYQDIDLPELIEKHHPDAILFPARWPETYSYTLSTAMHSGRPVIVPDIGAFTERVSPVKNGHIFPFSFSPADLIDYLLKLLQDDDEQSQHPDFDDRITEDNTSRQDHLNNTGITFNKYYLSEKNYPLTF